MILFCADFAKMAVRRMLTLQNVPLIIQKEYISYNVHGDMSGRLKTLSWNAKLVTLIVNADNSADQEQVIENEQSSGFRTAFLYIKRR